MEHILWVVQAITDSRNFTLKTIEVADNIDSQLIVMRVERSFSFSLRTQIMQS
jgi:hypothetical protein